MTDVFIEKISLADIDAIYPETMLSLFWEQGMESIRTSSALPRFSHDSRTTDSHTAPQGRGPQGGDKASDADLRSPNGQPPTDTDGLPETSLNRDLSPDIAAQVRLEKEAWLNTVYLSWGPCGYSLRRRASATHFDGQPETVGTLLFAPPRFCPTTFSMPSGPISPDAIALTSLHYNALEVDDDMLRVLIVTALHRLALRGISAVEAFGCSGTTDSMSAPMSSSDSPDDGAENLIADFEAQLEEKLNPKPCISDSLAAINHNVGDLIRTRTLLNSGFRVVTPHPIHPKLRIELDAELDWDEEMGHALDLSAKEPFMRSKLFSI